MFQDMRRLCRLLASQRLRDLAVLTFFKTLRGALEDEVTNTEAIQ